MRSVNTCELPLQTYFTIRPTLGLLRCHLLFDLQTRTLPATLKETLLRLVLCAHDMMRQARLQGCPRPRAHSLSIWPYIPEETMPLTTDTSQSRGKPQEP